MLSRQTDQDSSKCWPVTTESQSCWLRMNQSCKQPSNTLPTRRRERWHLKSVWRLQDNASLMCPIKCWEWSLLSHLSQYSIRWKSRRGCTTWATQSLSISCAGLLTLTSRTQSMTQKNSLSNLTICLIYSWSHSALQLNSDTELDLTMICKHRSTWATPDQKFTMRASKKLTTMKKLQLAKSRPGTLSPSMRPHSTKTFRMVTYKPGPNLALWPTLSAKRW